MKIVVSHLTRMQPGYICVAGYDPDTFEHLRPVLGRRLPRALLRHEGGPFDIGYVVDLGEVRDVGSAPELEDREFAEGSVQVIDRLPEPQFWRDVEGMSFADVQAGFGEALERHSNGFAVSLGQGSVSLACIAPEDRPILVVNDYGSLRCRFDLDDGFVDLSVTDIRLCESDQKTIKEDLVKALNGRITAGTQIVLALGLARPWQKPGDTEKRHWLQVNNIYLADGPFID